MSDWADKAYQELEDDLANGDISEEEFKRAVRELREEVRNSECHCDGDF